MKTNLLIIAFLMLSTFKGFKANAQRTCGSDAYRQQQLFTNPTFKGNMDAFEKVWQEK